MKKNLYLLLFLLCFSIVHGQVNIGQGIIAHYDFAGNTNDASGNNLTATNYGAQLTSDRFSITNAAYYYSGFSSYMSVSNNNLFNSNNALSVSVWVNLDDPATNQKIIGRTNISFNSGFIIGIQNGLVNPEFWDSQGVNHNMNVGIINNGWQHIVVTYASSSYLIVYVNGVVSDSIATSSLPIGSNNEPLIIGAAPWDQSYFLVTGDIDDIRIYDRAVNAAEVLALFNLQPVSVLEFNNNTHLQLYKNNNQQLQLASRKDKFIQELKIYTVAGKEIYKKSGFSSNTEINFNPITTGIYFYEIKYEGEFYRGKFLF